MSADFYFKTSISVLVDISSSLQSSMFTFYNPVSIVHSWMFQVDDTLSIITCRLQVISNGYRWKLCIFHIQALCWKGYLPNFLESTLLHQIFVSWVRDFKFWLLAYLLIFFNCGKFQHDWKNLILHILQGLPFEFWVHFKIKKTSRGRHL